MAFSSRFTRQLATDSLNFRDSHNKLNGRVIYRREEWFGCPLISTIT